MFARGYSYGHAFHAALAGGLSAMKDRPALVAIDLGAESCRVSMLSFHGDAPRIRIIRRFSNSPIELPTGFHWDLERICRELEIGLRDCASLAPEGIASIGVTGWAVDYVRLDSEGKPIDQPYCYRDTRNAAAMDALHAILPPDELYRRTGVQIQPLNTIYQLYADKLANGSTSAWLNLPEYILYWLGAPRIAEYTNATHTGLIDPSTRNWSDDLFSHLGLNRAAAPEIVAPGTALGPMRNDLAHLPAFAHTQLIAPACHDTASAVAGIPEEPGDWAYISSGTWSLVGMLLPESHRTAAAFAGGFTNLGAAGDCVLFHRGLAGMWLLRQCMDTWSHEHAWSVTDLIEEAEKLPPPDECLDLDDPALIAPGNMPARINTQRASKGLAPLASGWSAAPLYTHLIFHSLAQRYRIVLGELERISGRLPKRICVVGGGSRNAYLNALTESATGIPVQRCSVESSTTGNLALQWMQNDSASQSDFCVRLAAYARALAKIPIESDAS